MKHLKVGNLQNCSILNLHFLSVQALSGPNLAIWQDFNHLILEIIQYQIPDLTVNVPLPNQDQTLQIAQADIDHLEPLDSLDSDFNLDFLNIEQNYKIEVG